LQAFRRRPAGQRISDAACQHPQIEQILPYTKPGTAAARGVDKQCRKAGKMFCAGLDGIDPAPLALVEVGGRQQVADGQNSGQRRADFVRERRERGFDHTRGSNRGGALAARLARGNAWSAFFKRPPF